MRRLLRRAAAPAPTPSPPDPTVTAADREILERCAPLSLIGEARMLSLIDAVRHCVRRELPGAFAECGVWKGGAVLAMLLALQQEGRTDRDVFLFDTFEGMTEPRPEDTSAFERPALETWRAAGEAGRRAWQEFFDPATFGEEQVRENVLASGYPADRVHFVRGRVEDTVPGRAPERLALLRLDTDWYESTRHELEHLYPRLCDGGVLIVDDYGHWDGARRAVDEYFAGRAAPMLHRVDYTGRIAIKP